MTDEKNDFASMLADFEREQGAPKRRRGPKVGDGVEVQVAGVRAFCPISQLDLRHVEDATGFIGQKLAFRITRYEAGTRGRENVVLSRRALLEVESRAKAQETRARLQVGAVIQGK